MRFGEIIVWLLLFEDKFGIREWCTRWNLSDAMCFLSGTVEGQHERIFSGSLRTSPAHDFCRQTSNQHSIRLKGREKRELFEDTLHMLCKAFESNLWEGEKVLNILVPHERSRNSTVFFTSLPNILGKGFSGTCKNTMRWEALWASEHVWQQLVGSLPRSSILFFQQLGGSRWLIYKTRNNYIQLCQEYTKSIRKK